MGLPAVNKPKAVIFDMDGTLCDVTTIRHHVLSRKKNYDAFHYLSVYCPPNEWVAAAARKACEEGLYVLVVTARMDRWRLLTVNWLDHNDIPWDELHMRQDGDCRRDDIIKEEILLYLQRRYEIVTAFDDNPSVIALWERYDINTVVVPGWAEEEKEAVASNAQ
jgi:FMN phosphatase YigB (HAD superfamily)